MADTMELTVPTSLYGMAMCEPIVLNRNADGNFIYFIELFRVEFMLLVNYTIQLLFIWEVAQLDRESDVDCTSTNISLEMVCVFVFEVSIFTEIRNSMSLFSLLYNAPLPIAGYAKTIGSPREGGAILAGVDDSRDTWQNKITKRIRHPFPNDSTLPQWTIDGIGIPYRVWCALTIGLPKLTIAVLLAYYGGLYIAESADRETMLLNTLAVMFVIDVDEILYEAFTADHTKDNLATMKHVEVHTANADRLVMWFASTVIYPIVVFAVSFIVAFGPKMRECEDYHVPFLPR